MAKTENPNRRGAKFLWNSEGIGGVGGIMHFGISKGKMEGGWGLKYGSRPSVGTESVGTDIFWNHPLKRINQHQPRCYYAVSQHHHLMKTSQSTSKRLNRETNY